MTIKQQIITVAEWDGWKPSYGAFYKPINNIVEWKRLPTFDYHTNISSLYPVAKRVKEELDKIISKQGVGKDKYDNAYYLSVDLIFSAGKFQTPPTELFAAVFNGIAFLNDMK